jgi:hypothetical protein
MKIKIIFLIIFIYSGILFICLSNNSTKTAFAQSDSCTDGQSLVIDTVNKRYKCVTISSGGLGSGGNVNMTVANASSTGTTINRFAKLTGAPSTALITSTSDTENAIGVVTSGAGTTGSAVIAILGQVSCDFDNATTAGNYVTISAITAGKCHDAGSSYPTSGAAYGRVLTTNGASGTFSMELMTPDIAFQNAGNGKSKPGTPANSFQFNDSNQFGGGNLFREDANTVAQRNATTAQVFNFYSTYSSGGSTYSRLALKFSGSDPTLETESNSGTGGNLIFKKGSRTLTFTGVVFSPDSAVIDLGSGNGTAIWNEINGNNLHLWNGGSVWFNANGTELNENGVGKLFVRTHNNNGGGTGINVGDLNTNGFLIKKGTGGILEVREGDDSAYKTLAASSFKTGANTIYSSGTPSIAGNATLNTNSKNSAGKITSTGTGASTAVLTFSVAFSNAPACIVTNETTSNLVRPVSTTTTLTVNATVVTGDSISYICVGY